MKDFWEWIETRQRREQREGELSLWERQRRARQRLECAELAPALPSAGSRAGAAKAPASRTHSKRFAQSSAREAFKASLWVVDNGKPEKVYLLP